MPDDGQNGSSRLDRIEAILEALTQDHSALAEEHLQFRQDLRQLLTAQVLLQDRVTQLVDAQKHTDESLHALINIVDGIIRKPPQ